MRPYSRRAKKRRYVDIIDPIHGFVRATEREMHLIDSHPFQRLRQIKQLSGAHLVYPAAQHTRFEHSLGVMHVAGRAGDALVSKGAMDPDAVTHLRLAALLHDIGHGPFSHIFEEIDGGKSHEQFGRELILDSEIGDILDSDGFDKRLVSDIAFGGSKFRYLDEIVSGALSADMMDYLPRDGYFTGAEHARADYGRIWHSFEVHRNRLALERSALYSFESMVHSRYQMFKAVYFHKTVRAAEVMLLEALRLSDSEFDFTTFDPDKYLALTDDSVLLMLSNSTSPKLARARAFAEDYRNRRLIKCVYEKIVTDRLDLAMGRTDEIRGEISGRANVAEEDIFVDSSVTPSIPLTPSKHESESIVLVTSSGGRRVTEEMPISEIPIVAAISGFMKVLRIYTHNKNRSKVEPVAHAVLEDLE